MTEPTTDDRTMRAFRALTRNEDPQRTWQAIYEYAVQDADGSTFSGLPVDAETTPALPTRVPYRPSIAGATCTPTKGTIAYVFFANADQSKPRLLAFDATIPEAFTLDATSTIAIGASADEVDLAGGNTSDSTGLGRVVRYGDPILFSVPGQGVVSPGAVLNAFSKVKA